VKLDLRNYSNILSTSSFDSIFNKWFINLSHVSIPQNVQKLLQLGQNFSLPSTNIKNNIIQLIKNIENNIIKLHQDTQNEVRSRSMPIIHNLMLKSLYNESNLYLYISMLTIEITAPRVPCAHRARRAARSAERCDIRMCYGCLTLLL